MGSVCIGRYRIAREELRATFETLRNILLAQKYELRQERLLDTSFFLRGVCGHRLLALLVGMIPGGSASGVFSQIQCYVRAKPDPRDASRLDVYLRVSALDEFLGGEAGFATQDFEEILGDHFKARRCFQRFVGAAQKSGMLRRPDEK